MGMYDTIVFTCPHCRGQITEQSKAGASSLDAYSSDEVPPKIAADIRGDVIYCGGCGKEWMMVKLPTPPTVRMGLVEIT